ncbi:MAG: hypothetical protein ACOX3P_06075 [Saccharofermentanales bacterium]|jgi:hypothetical protein|nr:hypothetical protein [Bacillota bacterium]NLB08093.1 hypothetical protein [Clostridiales bacterium]
MVNYLYKQILSAGISEGMGVLSIKGRDAGRVFLVLRVAGRRLELADGRNRSLSRPKIKHQKHVKPLGHILTASEVANLLNSDLVEREKNIALRKQIEAFLDKIKIYG